YGLFQFAPLQGATARKRLGGSPIPSENYQTIVLVDSAGIHTRSTAVLLALSQLGGGWAVLRLLLAVPRPIRDTAYNFIAKRRYAWFGDASSCPIDRKGLDDRLLP